MRRNHIITVGEYPLMLRPQAAREALKILHSSETLAKTSKAIATKSAELCCAVLALIGGMEAAAASADWAVLFDATHEVRGLAGTAGLTATGRIANGLCQYLDAAMLMAISPDPSVIALHVEAVARSARTEDEAARHGDRVVVELAALVVRKLAEVKTLQTNASR